MKGGVGGAMVAIGGEKDVYTGLELFFPDLIYANHNNHRKCLGLGCG